MGHIAQGLSFRKKELICFAEYCKVKVEFLSYTDFIKELHMLGVFSLLNLLSPRF